MLYDPFVIDKALKKLRMPIQINDVNARTTQFCSELFNRPNAVGYGKFKAENSEQNVELMTQQVYSSQQKESMQRCIDLNNPLRKKVRNFIARLSTEADSCESYAIKKKDIPLESKPKTSNKDEKQ